MVSLHCAWLRIRIMMDTKQASLVYFYIFLKLDVALLFSGLILMHLAAVDVTTSVLSAQ